MVDVSSWRAKGSKCCRRSRIDLLNKIKTWLHIPHYFCSFSAYLSRSTTSGATTTVGYSSDSALSFSFCSITSTCGWTAGSCFSSELTGIYSTVSFYVSGVDCASCLGLSLQYSRCISFTSSSNSFRCWSYFSLSPFAIFTSSIFI